MQIAKNYLFNLLTMILQIAAPMLTIPYISHIFMPEQVGFLAYIGSVAKWFLVFATLGNAIYGTRLIAAHEDKREQLFNELFVFNAVNTILFYILFLISTIIFSTIPIYFILIQSVLILSNLFEVTWYFNGIQNFKITLIRNLITRILSILFIFSFVNNQDDLLVYLLIQLGTTLIASLLSIKYLPSIQFIMFFDYIQIFKKHFYSSFILFLPIFAIQIYTLLDRILLGNFSTHDQLGYYDSAVKIILLLMIFSVSSGNVLLPKLTQMIHTKKTNISQYIYRSFSFTMFTSSMIFLWIYIFNERFVRMFFGEPYIHSSFILFVLSPLVFILSFSNISSIQILLPHNMEKKVNISVYFGAMVSLLLNIILIPKYGALGAALAWIAAELLSTAIQFYYIRNLIHLNLLFSKSISYILLLLLSVFGFLYLPYTNLSIEVAYFVVCCIFTMFIFIYQNKDLFSRGS